MKLTFDAKLVQQLLDDSKNAKEWRLAYGEHSDPKDARPGLWMVGDRGVYLMSNSKNGVMAPESTPESIQYLVAYADQCNPNTAEDWYSAKREAFGGDDGVELLDVQLIEGALAKAKRGKMTLEVTTTSISY